MEETCKNGYCRKKLSEYRESTSKLYDEIDSLESDMRDKDDFLQKVVKARNAHQNEVSELKKKNRDLVEENNELLAKNDQLDEDAETGLMMVKSAHERERKLNKEIEEHKKNCIENSQNKSELEKENKNLKAKLSFLKGKYEKNLKANQESSNFNRKSLMQKTNLSILMMIATLRLIFTSC